uniref:Uncharacterized protein n=1 Tax=Dulem virus 40 TaxID=3145758 RepID=A0AAU8AVP6_9CAUD
MEALKKLFVCKFNYFQEYNIDLLSKHFVLLENKLNFASDNMPT